MPQSLSKVYVHITFSTKNRQHLIDDDIKDSLFEYLGGICKGLDCNPLKIGGFHDHIHIISLLSGKNIRLLLPIGIGIALVPILIVGNDDV
jgi:putative transposase